MDFNRAIEIHDNRVRELFDREVKSGEIDISLKNLNRFLKFEHDLFFADLYHELSRDREIIKATTFDKLSKEHMCKLPYRLLCYVNELRTIN